MKSLLALGALHSRSVSYPLMSQGTGLRQELLQQLLLLSSKGYFLTVRNLLSLVNEVSFVFEEKLNSSCCHVKDVSGVFVDVALEIEGLLWPGKESCLGGLCLCVLLEGQSIWAGVHFLGLEKEQPDLSKVLMLQPLSEIREFGICRPWIPSVPDGLTENCHMSLVPQMKRHVLQTIEEGSKTGGFPWTNAG